MDALKRVYSLSEGRRKNNKEMVGERRFELPTSWSRRKIFLSIRPCRNPCNIRSFPLVLAQSFMSKI